MGIPERQQPNGGAIVSNDTLRSIIIFIVIGIIAGWLASILVGGSGLLTYLIAGVIGSFVGGYLFSALKIRLPITNIWVAQIVTSTVGAIIVLLVARLLRV
jgi:uncharacterized membrane protein YeaQ/YmgE (transglycosylase-associated protein family)